MRGSGGGGPTMASDGEYGDTGRAAGDAGAAAAYHGREPFRSARSEPLLRRVLPITGQLRRYRLSHLGRDLLAGVTVAALGIPSAMAYGELAGLTPLNGFYAMLLPAVAYVFLGSSRPLLLGPEGSVATVIAAGLLPLAVAGSDKAVELGAMLAILTAACFFIAWLLRLGWIADYLSRPVLVGYIHGVAIVILIAQLGKLLGLSISARDPLDRLAENVRELNLVSGITIVVSATALAALFLLRRFLPGVPGGLIVVVAAIGVSWALDLSAHGVAVVGHLESGLPRLTVPTPAFSDVVDLVPAALAVFIVSFADEILTARVFAGRNREHVRASQELLAMGAANLAAGFTQAFSPGAAGSRTAANDAMGARSQIAGLVAAGTVCVILLFLTGPVQYLPTAVLGAIIVSAAIRLFEATAWRALASIDRVEVALAGVTTVCVVFFGVLQALVVAVGLSVIDTVRRSARPYDAVLGFVDSLDRYADVSLHPSARVTPGVVIYRLDDRLFFANADYVKGRVHEAITAAPTATAWIVFDAEAMMHIDSTGLESLVELAADLRHEGITLVVARVRERLRDEFALAGATEAIGHDHFYDSVEQAVAAYEEREARAGGSCSQGPHRG